MADFLPGVSFRIKAVGKHLLEKMLQVRSESALTSVPDRWISPMRWRISEPLVSRSTVRTSAANDHQRYVQRQFGFNQIDHPVSFPPFLERTEECGSRTDERAGAESKQAHLEIAKTLIQSTFLKHFLYGRGDGGSVSNHKREGRSESPSQDFEELEGMVRDEVTAGDPRPPPRFTGSCKWNA